MREIKFRCWDVKARFIKDDGTLPKGVPHMKYEIGLSVGKGWFTGIDGLHVNYNDPLLPIMQFTGIKDKNGKEIYENDLILDSLTKVVYNIKIGFCKKHGFVGVYGESVNIEGRVTPIAGDYGGDNNSQIEVIGNIYQNPELVTN
jgi:hypothetical protein